MDNGFKKLACKIRKFELDLLKEFKEGKVPGTIHCCIGQEYDIVRIIKNLKPGDIVTGNHRSHGHYLAFTEDFQGLKDEIMGLSSGVNKGKGLSQHLHAKDFYTTGVQGGMVPIACGMAMGLKKQETDNIVVCFIGDGTIGQGVLYEGLNIAGLWLLPICFVVENNQYAMSTPVHQSVSGCIKKRFKVFGLEEIHDYNVRRVTPSFKIINTYRFCGHSGNDNRVYRNRNEEYFWWQKDKLGGIGLDDFLH